MTDQAASTAFPHFAAAVDIANSQILLVAWSAIDTANADLRCWTVTESAITEVTNVVLNSTDDQGLAGIGINTTTGHWHVFYAGASGGGETFLTSVNVYTKVSTDAGTTWGPETRLTTMPNDTTWLTTCPRFTGPPAVLFHADIALDEILINVALPSRRATHQLFGG
jgi:hypothetical protein